MKSYKSQVRRQQLLFRGRTCDTQACMAQPERVLVTRAPHQGSALAQQLRAFGLEPVLIPAIEVVPPSSFEALDLGLAALESFDWVVFSSANAVQVFAERLQGRIVRAETKIAAIGAATARALDAANLRADLIPPQAVAESLSEALLPYAQRPTAGASRFLLVRAEEGRDYLSDRLREAGAEVTMAPAYRTVLADGSVDLLRRFFAAKESHLRAITFTSSSTVRNLLALCGAAEVDLPQDALRVSIGPITSATMRDAGYPPHAEAPAATIESLAQTVVQVLRRGRSSEAERGG